MSGFERYDDYDGLGLAALVAAGEVSAVELLEEAIARTELVNPLVNAVIHPMYEHARRRLAGPPPAGPFAGVPFLMKDLGQAVAGEPLRNGSRFFVDYVPDYDAEMVRRLHDAGLVSFGKTSTPELGLVGTTEPVLFGPTRNPWDLERVAGGSSGGSGAAVAAGIVPLASAGDGGGSIRIPAACCGLFGLKPSRGRNPSGPELGEGWYGQVQHGVISRSVRDSAAVLDATHGGDAGMPYAAPPPPLAFLDECSRAPGRLRVAVCRTALCSEAPLDPECLAALDDTAQLLEELGHAVIEAEPPLERVPLGVAFMLRVLACTGAEIADAERLLGRRSRYDEFEPTTRAFANLARSFTAVDLTLANRTIERQMRALGRFMQDYDVLLTPTLATPPAPLGVFDPEGADALLTKVSSRVGLGPLVKWTNALEQLVHNNFTFVVSTMVANMSGEPSMSVPLAWSRAGLPIGMMFTARIYEEAILFRLAAQLEQARPWFARRAPHHAATTEPIDA
ncbi:MAG: amidase [Gammaproteobacteria bacterium]